MRVSFVAGRRPGVRLRSPLALLALLLLAGTGGASAAEPRVARAERIDGGAVRVDGVLDEAAWGEAPFTSGFVQKNPNEGEPSTRRTEIAFLFDDEALYVGARMEAGSPEEIRSITSRRDNAGNSERLIVCLDTYHDRRTSTSFAVTASGVRVDYYHPEDEEGERDYSFDPVWEARTQIGNDGWTAEMRIPFSQLRFTDREEQVWGLNVNRWMPDRNEDTYWVLVPKSESGWASRFGELRGIGGIRPSRRVEVLPYIAGDARFAGEIDPATRSPRRGRSGGARGPTSRWGSVRTSRSRGRSTRTSARSRRIRRR
ncbi:MAG: carbohydrate binding family 9 domain-containing protein [Candidatus Eisenbacteria bacterium]